jgi:hypothetical protein
MREGQLWATVSIRQAGPARTRTRERRGLGLAQPGAGGRESPGRRTGQSDRSERERALAGEPCCLPSIGSLLGRNERGKSLMSAEEQGLNNYEGINGHRIIRR